jgi:hypothetical protein
MVRMPPSVKIISAEPSNTGDGVAGGDESSVDVSGTTSVGTGGAEEETGLQAVNEITKTTIKVRRNVFIISPSLVTIRSTVYLDASINCSSFHMNYS